MANGGVDADWGLIEDLLPTGWRELGEEMGLVKKRPAHIGQKVLDIGMALRLVLHYVAQRGSQRATVAAAAAASLVSISQVALFKWMRKIGVYLEALVARMVEPSAFASKQWGDYVLIVADATTVERPGATGTTARVHYALQLCDLRPRFIRVSDAKVGETMRNFDPAPGELWIVDRGYANPPSILATVERGADIVVRHNRSSLPLYDANGERIDVLALLRATARREHAVERQVQVRANKERFIQARLCWMRLSQADAAKARARAERERIDPEELDAAEYIVVVTTAPRGRLTAEQVLTLYRARWQVELDFKRDKSIGELDRLPSELPETIHAWICAKILLDLIARRLASRQVSVPPCGLAAAIFPPLAASAAPRRGTRRRALVRDAADLVLDPLGTATDSAGGSSTMPRPVRRSRRASQRTTAGSTAA